MPSIERYGAHEFWESDGTVSSSGYRLLSSALRERPPWPNCLPSSTRTCTPSP
jgi:hypothetical protein